MTRFPALICAVGAAGASLLGSAPAVATTPDSGLRGRVLYGPTCPVQRPGAICERPYQATLVVSRTASRGTVARVSTSADGRFTVPLRAGSYLVRVTSHTTYPRSWSQKISVTRHHFTSLTIRIDSGIR
ncbi:MAG: carboxypeptidase-like regulatory domain-containing protein [Actinomycetota bacterium]|nr:carboxypeptidase-like regulatory domain-containing protein [Actinomycetota bacterium]